MVNEDIAIWVDSSDLLMDDVMIAILVQFLEHFAGLNSLNVVSLVGRFLRFLNAMGMKLYCYIIIIINHITVSFSTLIVLYILKKWLSECSRLINQYYLLTPLNGVSASTLQYWEH